MPYFSVHKQMQLRQLMDEEGKHGNEGKQANLRANEANKAMKESKQICEQMKQTNEEIVKEING